MAWYITRHILTTDDPQAMQLLSPPFVSSLFVTVMDNCAPITGITRYDYASEDGDGGGGCGTDDLVEFLALLAPEVSASVCSVLCVGLFVFAAVLLESEIEGRTPTCLLLRRRAAAVTAVVAVAIVV